MEFLSFSFTIYLPVVFIIYWQISAKRFQQQNFFLLVSSYLFYSWSDWRFAIILGANSLICYYLALGMNSSRLANHKKKLLTIGILFGVGILATFKYFNFFLESFSQVLGVFGFDTDIHTLNLILPIGISYYLFKSTSYLIEVYKNRFTATSDILAVFLYIGFFPQLIAGPIDRPSNLLLQILKPRIMNLPDIYLGMKQGLWGLFKKLVIANTLATSVNWVFNDITNLTGPQLLCGAVFFAIQIYCDFSGLTDIANGCARILGFNPAENFAQPYFSRDIAEFWRRWHISLTSWFRDYIFYPLGGGIKSRWTTIRNILITFTLSGLWHGANWTFIVWGFLHGLLFIPIILGIQKTHSKKFAYKRVFPKVPEVFHVVLTFALVTFTWVIFRSDTILGAYGFIKGIFLNYNSSPKLNYIQSFYPSFLYLIMLIPIEWLTREAPTPLAFKSKRRIIRWTVWSLILFMVLLAGNFSNTKFLYEQF